MASNKLERFGPAALPNAAADILHPAPAPGAGAVGYVVTASYIILRHIRIVNKTAGAVTFSMWLGATGASAAGTEVIGNALSVPANSAFDWYGMLRIKSTEYLVGLASAAASLTWEGEGEVGFE
jgi:hypothetical protein